MAVFFAASNMHRQRSFTHRRNPLTLPEEQFIHEYRLTHSTFNELKLLLKSDLEKPTKRSKSLSVDDQILISLKLLGSGSFQNVAKDFIGVSQPTVSRCLDGFLNAILKHRNTFIHMPQGEAVQQNKIKFYEKSNFPGVIGAIDGTHIAMIAPPQNEYAYVCRKGFHSLNMQVRIFSTVPHNFYL